MSINAGVYSLAPARAAYAKAKDALAIAAGEQGETAEAKYVEATIAFGERNWPVAERALSRALISIRITCSPSAGTHGCLSRWGGPPRRGRCFNAPGRSIRSRRTHAPRPGSVSLRRGSPPTRCGTCIRRWISTATIRWRFGRLVSRWSRSGVRKKGWRSCREPARQPTRAATSTRRWDGPSPPPACT